MFGVKKYSELKIHSSNMTETTLENGGAAEDDKVTKKIATALCCL